MEELVADEKPVPPCDVCAKEAHTSDWRGDKIALLSRLGLIYVCMECVELCKDIYEIKRQHNETL